MSRLPRQQNQLIRYSLLVGLATFVFLFIAACIILSWRLVVGTIALGIFLGYLVYTGWYNR